MDTITRMRAFTQVVEAGGFSAAARKLGKSKALVSKYVRELEDELGARLLNRTTRKLSLTDIGQSYYRDSTELLARLAELHASVRDASREARGLLRITGPRTFGDGELARAIMEFLQAHPLVEAELKLEDRFVDVVEEGFDVAIRITELADSSLVGRKLVDFRVVTVATPGLIAAYGRPAEPRDLVEAPCVIDSNSRQRNSWSFLVGGERLTVPVRGRVEVNSPLAARQAALAGMGFVRIPYVLVERDVLGGALHMVLQDYELRNLGIYILYPHRRHLSTKVRAFVDFMVDWFSRNWCKGEAASLPAAA